jgi:hypothetical protein
LYVPRKQEGRGLMQIEAAHVVEIERMMEYFAGRKPTNTGFQNAPTQHRLSSVTDS